MAVNSKSTTLQKQELQMTANPISVEVVNAVSKVPGVVAIALGGSRSLGVATPQSDFDIAVFERGRGDIQPDDVREAIKTIADGQIKLTKDLALAEFTVQERQVELFFRRTTTIAKEIGEAKTGKFTRWQHVLHPNGFLSTAQISYATYGRALWDPEGELAALIKLATPYPDALREQMLKTFRGEAALTLIHAAKVKNLTELPYLSALYARAVSAWTLALFATNRRYPIIDKGAQRLVMTFPIHPEHFHGRTIKLFKDIAAGNLQQARLDAIALHKEIAAYP